MSGEWFTFAAEGLSGLLDAVDIDDVADVETLLMIICDRPIEVRVVENDEGDEALEVTAWTEEVALTTIFSFPTSILSLAQEVRATLAESNLPVGQITHVPSMTEEEWRQSLMRALGQVRIFNILDSDD